MKLPREVLEYCCKYGMSFARLSKREKFDTIETKQLC
jgi:hypothetical protein